MSSEYSRLKEQCARTQQLYKPELYRIGIAEDKRKLDELLAGGLVFLHDEIYDQLKELLKSRNPKLTLNAGDYARLITAHLDGCNIDEYGVWVYYPWSRRVVHILDEAEFIELRTAANKNKITLAERDTLASKKVGVIGLSVGQSVSLTLALERGCGELRLADFDTLELNNLNRIRTGVHNLGLLKAYAVAREIVEIDPYFKVVCYTDGITGDNINDFFLEGGKLDAVIDECDGINIKILCRIKAKELNVPVLMEASDRGTLDVERFDLDPKRPIMHGWLEHLALDLDVLKNLKTNEEKIPYILPISGLETLSSRMKASMVEMRNTITTWPQLATAVTLGGALTADTCRRIFLDQFRDSGRYFIDLEQIVPDSRSKVAYKPFAEDKITDVQIRQAANELLKTLSPAAYKPAENEVKELVSYAIMAPSPGNAQPWKWHYTDGYLFLFYSSSGAISFSDFEHMASYIACGAAIENLQLAAFTMHLHASIQLLPNNGEQQPLAAIKFDKNSSSENIYKQGEMAPYITSRVTNRSRGANEEIDAAVLEQMKEAVASVPGAELIIKTGNEQLQAIGNIVGPVERLKLLSPEGHYEFFEYMQWDDDKDVGENGISIKSLGISPPEELLLKMIKNYEVAKLLRDWKGGQALEMSARLSINSASGMGLITMPATTAADYINGGKAVERMWLAATRAGVAIHPMMTPVLYFARMKKDGGNDIPDFMKDELAELHQQFISVFGAGAQDSLFLFKLGVSAMPVVSPERKKIEHVFSI